MAAFDSDVPGLDTVGSSSILKTVNGSGRSVAIAAPAAAIICGLKGLEDELARLPFLECCIPWTIEVWRWCPYEALFGSTGRSKMPGSAARDWDACRRGEVRVRGAGVGEGEIFSAEGSLE